MGGRQACLRHRAIKSCLTANNIKFFPSLSFSLSLSLSSISVLRFFSAAGLSFIHRRTAVDLSLGRMASTTRMDHLLGFSLFFLGTMWRQPITDDMIERNSVHVTLHDVDPTALRQLIDYTYTGEVTITEDNVQVYPNIFVLFVLS